MFLAFFGGSFFSFCGWFLDFLNFLNMFLFYSKSYVGSIFFILLKLSTIYVFGIFGVLFLVGFLTF